MNSLSVLKVNWIVLGLIEICILFKDLKNWSGTDLSKSVLLAMSVIYFHEKSFSGIPENAYSE